MAFDPTTASLAEDKPSTGGFDPSTALPVESETPKEKQVGTKPRLSISEEMAAYQKDEAKNVKASEAFLASGAEAVGATPGALAGARAGMAIPQPTWTKPITGIVGGFVGGYLASKGITSLEGAFDSVFGTKVIETRQQQQKEYPGYSLAGQVAGGSVNPFMRPGLPESIKQGVFGAGVMTGIGAGQRAISGENVFDPKSMVIDAATGAFTKPTKLGEKMLGQVPTSTTTKPTTEKTSVKEATTPEEKTAVITKLKDIVAKRDAESPIVEAAIRNKETGEIERMGPKHNEDRKKELGLMPIDKKTLEEAVAPWSHLPQEQQDLIRKYVELTHETSAAEKSSDPKTWTPEQKAAYERGDSAEFSRLRGYSKEDIAKYKEWQKTTADVIKLLGEDEAFGIVHFLNNKHSYSHEAGFIDERGNFHERKTAVDQAKRAGQLPEDHALEIPEDGLHSGDLRKVGDKRFAITEDQPAGQPKPPIETTVPKTREEYKTALDENEYQRAKLEIEANNLAKQGKDVTSINERIKALENDQAQLRKDIPEVQFSNKVEPTWDELHDHLWGAKTVGEAFDRIKQVGVGSRSQKALLAVLSKSKFIRDASISFSNDSIPYTDKYGVDKNDAAGLYSGDKHHIDLGKEGNLQVFMHETIHAGTHGLIEAGNSKAAIQLQRLLDLHKDGLAMGTDAAMEKYSQVYPKATIKEIKAYRDYLEYGITNSHEFIAEAFTNPQFMKLLSQLPADANTPVSKTSNMWTAFKQIIFDGLGIKERTALDDVLDQGMKMIEKKQDKKFTGIGTTGHNQVASRLSQEIHDQLKQEGIPVAHSSPHKFDMFNWVKHALSGEGNMVFGAGTYHSTADGSDIGYHLMSKNIARESYIKKNPIIASEIKSLSSKIDSLNTKKAKVGEQIKNYYDEPKVKKSIFSFKEESALDSYKKINKLYAENKKYSDQIKEHKKALQAIEDRIDSKNKVPTYHSTIDAKPEEFLDWNASKQSDLVNKAFKALGIDTSTNKTGEELYVELSNKFLIKGKEFSSKNEADAKASIALAEQGVVGNVHNSQFGKNENQRNYVTFDDTRIKQNFVSLASKGSPEKPSSEGTKEPVVDRTKTDPRDVRSLEEFEQIAADIYEKHGEVDAVKFYEGYKEYKKTWLEPIAETEKFVGMNLRGKAANERIIHNDTADMKSAITDPARREAIALAVDSGDLSGLSPQEKAVANKYSELVRDIGERAVEKGVVKGLLEDYVTHIIDWTGAPKGAREEFLQALLGTASRDPAMRGMTTESKFGKERKFKTFADLEWYINEANDRIAAAGKSDYRLQIKTKDIAEIYKEYATSMEKAIENKNLVDSLKQVRNENGESLIKEVNKENPLPYGWKMMDSPQFAGYAVHPDMEPALKFVFDAGPGDLMKALGMVSQVTKRINVVGSFFHAKSLMEVMSSAQIPIWTPIKEAIVLPLVEKSVKAVTGKELQLSAISKAVDQYKKGGVGTNVDKWIREDGLQLEIPEDVAKGILSATGKFADSMIGKYGPKTRVLEKSLSAVEKYTLGVFDKYTWDYLHTGGKIMVADAYLDKARLAAAKEGKPFDEAAARKEIAGFVNNSFGGLNWFDAATQTQNHFAKQMAMAAYSPQGRRGLQVALFAPDWTISTLRAFTDALPKGLNPTKWSPVEGIKGMMTPTTKADYARLYQFKTALTYLTLLNAINLMTANRPIWDNKDPTRIEWPDGTSMQAMKHAMEPYHWIADPDKTLANKMGFIPKAIIVAGAGIEYASPSAEKLVDRSILGRAEAVAKIALPFQASAGMSAPKGEGVKRAILGTAGFPIYGSDKGQKKAARANRELATKEQAWEYRDKEIKSGRMPMTSKHTQEGQMLKRRRQKIEQEANK